MSPDQNGPNDDSWRKSLILRRFSLNCLHMYYPGCLLEMVSSNQGSSAVQGKLLVREYSERNKIS
jgi:hypothetical protein